MAIEKPADTGFNAHHRHSLRAASGRILLASSAMTASGGPTTGVPTRLAVACLVAVLLTGCQDEDPGGTSGSEPADPSSGSSQSSSPGSSQSGGVEPADGPVVENAHASYRVPRGYEVGDEQAGTIPADDSGPSRSAITLAEVPAFGNTDLGMTARVLARNVAQDRPPKVLADSTLDGVPAFHLEGQLDETFWFAAYGAVRDDTVVYVRFDLDGSPAKSQEVVESVLATWHWK
jgi:hypothetical protein